MSGVRITVSARKVKYFETKTSKRPNSRPVIISFEEEFEARQYGGKLKLYVYAITEPETSVQIHEKEYKSVIGVFGASFHIGLDDCNREACITNGSVLINEEKYRDIGIGTRVLNRCIEWVKEYAPHCKVRPLRLSEVDGEDEVNRERRNWLYKKFGMSIATNDNGISGRAHVASTECLKCLEEKEMIKEIEFENKYRELDRKNRELQEKYQREIDRSEAICSNLKTRMDNNRKLVIWGVVIIIIESICIYLLLK